MVDKLCIKCNRIRRCYAKNMCKSCYTMNRTKIKNIKIPKIPSHRMKMYNQTSRYGITKWDIYSFLRRQKGKCPICRKTFTKENSYVVDHCHNKNKVRGLLCHNCNRGLGFFSDSYQRMARASKYIESRNGN